MGKSAPVSYGGRIAGTLRVPQELALPHDTLAAYCLAYCLVEVGFYSSPDSLYAYGVGNATLDLADMHGALDPDYLCDRVEEATFAGNS